MSSTESDRRVVRQRLIAAREALQPTERRQLTAELASHLRELLERLNPTTLGFCWPFRGEADLCEFLGQWREQGVGRQLALPVVPAIAGPLAFHLWTPGDALVLDRFGIPTPQATPATQPEVVLVPVNGFDARGYRIGYGGGFFDRTLASLQPRPLSIGIGFEIARLDDVQPEPHDLPLDWIVTEAGIVVRPAP